MAEMAKRRAHNNFCVGGCISVPKNYFGIEYASALPPTFTKLYGRIQWNKSSKVIVVKWDIDDVETDVNVDRIIIEEQDTPVQDISNPNDEDAVTHAALVENNLEDIDGCAITIHPNEVAEIAEALNNKTNASTNSEESDAEEYIRKLPKLKGSKGRKKKKGENGKKKRGNKGGIVKESVNENEGHDEVIEGGDQEGGKNRVRKSTRKRKQVGKGYQEDDDEEEDEGEGEEEEEEELEDFNIEDGDDEVSTKKKKFQLKENEGKKMKPRGRSTRKRKENDQNQEDDSNKGKSGEKEKNEEEDEVTTETELEDEIESDSKKLEEQKKIWKKGGWDIDPDTSFPRGPKLHMDDPSTKSELDFFIHFFPMAYLREEIIPATNSFARKNRKSWNDIMEEEMLHFFGILKAIEVYKLSERRMHWASMKDTMFPAMNFSEFMTITRFEEIVKFLQLSNSPDPDKQVLDFIAAVNQHLLHALTPGKFITLDESVIKSYHKNLKGKIKIKCKPRPIGNEIKDRCGNKHCNKTGIV